MGCCCLALVVVCAQLPARAVEPAAKRSDLERAKAYFKDGLAKYNAGSYADAVTAFENGYAITKRPLFLYNIAQAERAAGHVDVALAYYRRYMTEESDAQAPEIANAARWVNVLSHGTTPTPPTPDAERPAMSPSTTAAPALPHTDAAPVGTGAVLAAPVAADRHRSSTAKRALLWTGLSVIVAGVAVGLGLGLGLHRTPPRTTLDPVAF